ncbi:MAG: hypothetical protein HOO89_08280 [Ferruginibacter sp.]|nr:hypothetical protein [Ferruginibacter sp.]
MKKTLLSMLVLLAIFSASAQSGKTKSKLKTTNTDVSSKTSEAKKLQDARKREAEFSPTISEAALSTSSEARALNNKKSK